MRVSAYLPRNARALIRARQLGGEIKYLSQGEIEARNRGYSPYSVETWRTWEYWTNKAGCGRLLTRAPAKRLIRKMGGPLEPTSPPRREAVPASEFRPGKKQASLSGYRWFESISLQRGVTCEPEFSQDRSSRPISRGRWR